MSSDLKTSYKKFNSLAEPLFSPWLSDKEFLEINSNYPEWLPETIQANRYLQFILAKQAVLVNEGDFIECGVYTGKSSDIFASVLDKYDNFNKKLFLIDSFEGLPTPNDKDVDVRTNKSFFTKEGVKGWDLTTIKNHLSKHKCSINLLKGWIPKPFVEINNRNFCFAHIDVDLYESTYDSLIFIYPKMVKGGIILFDDYGFPMCTGARLAIDEYLQNKTEPLIPLPSGQAILIKS